VFFFDPMYLILISPALLLAFWAQMRVKSSYAQASQIPARLTGAEAADRMLKSAGIYDVGIEPVGGVLSDHYDPRNKVLRLSSDVYGGRSLAALGIAAHEAGHAIQDAHNYAPLLVRNAVVPVAGFGSQASMFLLIGGVFFSMPALLISGIVLFSVVVFFQIVNLPVEFDASARAKTELVGMGLVNEQEMPYVRKVLNAAAMTYVAATLQSILTLLYYVMRYAGSRD